MSAETDPAQSDSAWTLHAKHEDGRSLTFVDYVPEGATVDLWADPDSEVGFLGACVVYRDAEGWHARDLTAGEREARLLRQARRRDLSCEERLRDPEADAGSTA
jgi:hypothetical protein